MSATATSSGALTAGTYTLANGRCFLNSINVTGDGTNGAVVVVYDSLTGTGKAIAAVTLGATGVFTYMNFSRAVRCDTGLTVVVTGTGANVYVNFGAA